MALYTLDEKINATDSASPGVPRLGIPAYNWWSEALHGVADSPGVNFSDQGDFSYATSFPQPILMGAAFDDQLIRDVATVVSTEARAFNNANRTGLDFWTPNINPFRDPRWGRGQGKHINVKDILDVDANNSLETPGEDPFHLSSYVHNLIQGLQGDASDPYKRVVATCKHFAGYDLENWNGNHRYQFDAQISQQDLVEYYLPPFQSCARDSNVGSFMCSYSEYPPYYRTCYYYLIEKTKYADTSQTRSMVFPLVPTRTSFRLSYVSTGDGRTKNSMSLATVMPFKMYSFLINGRLLEREQLQIPSMLERILIVALTCPTTFQEHSHRAFSTNRL